MSELHLSRQIRSERARKRIKDTFQRTLFTRICALVKKYTLGQQFLDSLSRFPDRPSGEEMRFDSVKGKEAFEPPLFCLSTPAEYRVIMAIISKVNNPYLNFVSSPDEILLCGPLFRQNPSLPPERLARFHFESLLLAEVAEKQIRPLTEQVQRLLREQEARTADNAQMSLLQARIERLRRFVARLEEAGGS